VFVSFVRCNAQARVGFVSDMRRLNVALTRARFSLYLVGHASTLFHAAATTTMIDARHKQQFSDDIDELTEALGAASLGIVAAGDPMTEEVKLAKYLRDLVIYCPHYSNVTQLISGNKPIAYRSV